MRTSSYINSPMIYAKARVCPVGYALIVIAPKGQTQDLDIQRMTQSNRGSIEEPGTDVKRKSQLNRSILDSLWGEFKRQLQYKSKWYGSRVILIPPEYSSQECCKCGHTEEGNRPNRDLFRCLNPRCQHQSCADLKGLPLAEHRVRCMGYTRARNSAQSKAAAGSRSST